MNFKPIVKATFILAGLMLSNQALASKPAERLEESVQTIGRVTRAEIEAVSPVHQAVINLKAALNADSKTFLEMSKEEAIDQINQIIFTNNEFFYRIHNITGTVNRYESFSLTPAASHENGRQFAQKFNFTEQERMMAAFNSQQTPVLGATQEEINKRILTLNELKTKVQKLAELFALEVGSFDSVWHTYSLEEKHELTDGIFDNLQKIDDLQINYILKNLPGKTFINLVQAPLSQYTAALQ